MNSLLKQFILLLAALAIIFGCSKRNEKKPNVILIMVDDQGYGDIAAIKTPNIDALHSISTRLTDYYVNPTYVPTRAAIMTLSDYEIVNDNTVILKTENQTLKAEVFSDDGALLIKDEIVSVKHLREGGPGYRIGIDFVEPLTEGSLTVKYTPVL